MSELYWLIAEWNGRFRHYFRPPAIWYRKGTALQVSFRGTQNKLFCYLSYNHIFTLKPIYIQ